MEISLGEAITMTARNKPDAPSFVFADGSAHTFAQTNARVNRLASALRAEGVQRGDRLAVLSLDSHRHVEIVLAALKLGVVYGPLNYRLRRGEIDTLVKRAEPVAFFYDVRYADLLRGLPADHPAVAQSAVVGVPDEYWSEIVRAWVTLRPGAAVTADELAAHCGQRLATYKVPAGFRFADALPVNASGKILKRELRTRD